MNYELSYTSGQLIPAQDMISHQKLISEEKSKIDGLEKIWNRVKKNIHDYEYIYTSPNRNRNISQIIPISRSYFKLKEMLIDSEIKMNQSTIFCMAEAPGGFIQSLLEHKVNISKIYANTLFSKNKDVPNWNHSLLNEDRIDFYPGINKDGDLCNMNNLLSYIKYIGNNAVDLVTGDGGFDYSEDYNKQEINSVPLIYSEIFLALNLLKKGGCFICKVFDIFLKPTIQLLYILTTSFCKTSIRKPNVSRLSNSEKYIVCTGYKGYNKKINNLLMRSFQKKDMSIQIDKNYQEKINQFNKIYSEIQVKQIQKGLLLIRTNKISNNPSLKQINEGILWCKKYNIPINQYCYYIRGQSSHLGSKSATE